ncbi:PREDICTED: uncharacterized protein LOC109159827 [Ipomoea nil]|uniref:uncharacterized protein LOC109159827 n=1 Tax=Ipomoea nil TaxID=35883 RepID=UPI000901D86F|nr:PREDICTED: uncharacterized protein LOC109159827 [Ipomoea nil]
MNAKRIRQGFTVNGNCNLCYGLIESTEHILRYCPKARELWEHLLPNMLRNSQNLSLTGWLDAGINGFHDSNRKQKLSFTFAVSEINSAFKKMVGPASQLPNRTWRFINWLKPPMGWIKSFMHKTGVCAAETTEAWGLMKGIRLAILLGSKKTIFECDSSSIIDAIGPGLRVNNLVDNILHACRCELRNVGEWNLVLTAREQNQAADFPARCAHFHSNSCVLDDPPDDLMQILVDDRGGVPASRLCVE